MREKSLELIASSEAHTWAACRSLLLLPTSCRPGAQSPVYTIWASSGTKK